MTPDHPLYDLLHDWSNHEPGRVVLTIGSTIAVRVQGIAFGASMPGVVLAAVIEAVEARGWKLALVHNPWRTSRPSWGAYISRHEEGDFALDRRDHDGADPAEAVLSAYVAALEAEAGQ